MNKITWQAHTAYINNSACNKWYLCIDGIIAIGYIIYKHKNKESYQVFANHQGMHKYEGTHTFGDLAIIKYDLIQKWFKDNA